MKKDEKVIYHCSQAVDDDALDELIRNLTDEAWLSGGFVAMFGPPELFEGLEEEAGGEPQAPARLRGLTGPWWPPK